MATLSRRLASTSVPAEAPDLSILLLESSFCEIVANNVALHRRGRSPFQFIYAPLRFFQFVTEYFI